jgi:septal ring factor EnvC (AmiA/AmiB activator)
MKNRRAWHDGRAGRVLRLSLALGALALAACSANPSLEETASRAETAALAYHQAMYRMSLQELGRERQALAAEHAAPEAQVRLAMLLGYPRGQQDLPRAIAVLDGVLKSGDPAAVSLHPLARLLGDHFGERQKLEAQIERQAQQLREAQRKALDSQGRVTELQARTAELQSKLDSLADIERTLPQRPKPGRSSAAGGGR